MKRLAVLLGLVVLAGTAIYFAESRKAEAPVSLTSLFHMLADTQREASRLPAAATRISDQEEIAIGDQMVAREWAPPADASASAIQSYIERVGARVALHTHRRLPYHFHYLPYPDLVNAFALPGGHVFLGEGLLALMDSEDQLAAVLGHEIEHIDQRHCVERVQLEARMRRLRLGVAGDLAQIPVSVFQAGYTKNQELEADREGTRLAVFAGYSAMGAIRLFETMERRYGPHPETARKPSLRREIGQLAVEGLTGYFQSHPPPEARIQQIQELIVQQKWEARSERPLDPAAIAQHLKAKPEIPAASQSAPSGGGPATPPSSPSIRVSERALQPIAQPPPVYPTMARMARVQGPVVMQVVIDKAGAVASVRVVSGHPMLQEAARDAVQQWRYRPYLLNREPVEVETTVTVNFQLSGS